MCPLTFRYTSCAGCGTLKSYMCIIVVIAIISYLEFEEQNKLVLLAVAKYP